MHKWGFGPMETIKSEAFYRMIGRTGITYGDTFRMVKRVASNDAAAMMRCVAFPLSTSCKAAVVPVRPSMAQGPHTSTPCSWRLHAHARAGWSNMQYLANGLPPIHSSDKRRPSTQWRSGR